MSSLRRLALSGLGLVIVADRVHLPVNWPLSILSVVLIRQHQRGRVCHDRGRDRDRRSESSDSPLTRHHRCAPSVEGMRTVLGPGDLLSRSSMELPSRRYSEVIAPSSNRLPAKMA
jgi:hypothetical protein